MPKTFYFVDAAGDIQTYPNLGEALSNARFEAKRESLDITVKAGKVAIATICPIGNVVRKADGLGG